MKIIKYLTIVVSLPIILTSCSNHRDISSTKAFTQAQVQYQGKDAKKKARALGIMPSYYKVMHYESNQVKLTQQQQQELARFIAKVDYPDEYVLYLSLGLKTEQYHLNDAGQTVARAKALNKLLQKQFKEVQVAMLPSQEKDSLYVRLLG